MAETSTKPYLIRAIYEWCNDNGYTPYLAVAVDERTQVPREHVKAGEIVLNVSPMATNRLSLGNDVIAFQARFGGAARELFVHVQQLERRDHTKDSSKLMERARQQIRDRLTQLTPIFMKNKFMLGEDFSRLDVAIAPLLWRLDHYAIEMPKTAAPLMKYAERIFSRPAYIEALTPSEKVMRR